MFLYYAYLFPMSRNVGARVLRGRHLVRQRRSCRTTRSAASAGGKARTSVALIVISRLRNLARRLTVPGENYAGAAPAAARQDRQARHPFHRHRPGSAATTTSGRTLRGGDGSLAGSSCVPTSDIRSAYGRTSDLEGLPQGQPGEHPDQGVPGDRVERDDLLQPAARRVPDAHPAEDAGARTATARCRTPRSSRATSSRRGSYVVLSEEDFDKVRPESTRVIDLVQFADESSIDPMYVDRTYYLAPDGGVAGRRVRRHARRHEGQGRRRQARAVRPRVSRRRPPARARHRHAHAASRGGDPRASTPVDELSVGAVDGEAGGDQAGAGR